MVGSVGRALANLTTVGTSELSQGYTGSNPVDDVKIFCVLLTHLSSGHKVKMLSNEKVKRKNGNQQKTNTIALLKQIHGYK